MSLSVMVLGAVSFAMALVLVPGGVWLVYKNRQSQRLPPKRTEYFKLKQRDVEAQLAGIDRQLVRIQALCEEHLNELTFIRIMQVRRQGQAIFEAQEERYRAFQSFLDSLEADLCVLASDTNLEISSAQLSQRIECYLEDIECEIAKLQAVEAELEPSHKVLKFSDKRRRMDDS